MTRAFPSSIPYFALSDFVISKHDFAQALGNAFRDFGFVALTNHGVSDAVINDNYTTSKAFFALPDAAKRCYHDPAGGGQSGYTPFGHEGAKDRQIGDLKEFWHTGRDVPPHLPAQHPARALIAKTPEVAEISGFNANSRALFHALDSAGQIVLAALALYLDLPENFFVSRTALGDSKLRLLHYPPIADLNTPALRAGAHEDINLITLLVGAGEPGLEVLAHSAENGVARWIPIDTTPGTIICNIGDMLQRFTNDVLPSTTHRVVNPTGAGRLRSRYSAPYFLHLNSDVVIEALPSCIRGARPARYPPIVAHDYLCVRLHQIGLLKALPERLKAMLSA